MNSSRWRLAALSGCVASLLALTVVPSYGLTQVPGPIRIGPSWAQGDQNDHSARLYTTIVNRGVLADRLSGGACPGFGNLALVGVDPATEGNRPQDQGVFLPPGSTEKLAPSGPHFALTDATRPMSDGQLIPCSLSFVHSGQRIVVFAIGAPTPRTFEP